MAKQFVAVNPDGYVIGDDILFHLEEDDTRPSAFRRRSTGCTITPRPAATKCVSATTTRFTAGRPVLPLPGQGPGAMEVIREARGRSHRTALLPHDALQDRGKEITRCAMAWPASSGIEMCGPWADNDVVHAAILEAGKKHGLVQVGGRAYHTNALESGWLRARASGLLGRPNEGLSRVADREAYETTAPLGGSFYSDDIKDYYFTPYELDYGRIVKFDHDSSAGGAGERGGRRRDRAAQEGHVRLERRRRRRGLRLDLPPGHRCEVHQPADGALRHVPR